MGKASLFLIAFIIVGSAAAFSFQDYVGTTKWSVEVSETGCGLESAMVNTYPVTISP